MERNSCTPISAIKILLFVCEVSEHTCIISSNFSAQSQWLSTRLHGFSNKAEILTVFAAVSQGCRKGSKSQKNIAVKSQEMTILP